MTSAAALRDQVALLIRQGALKGIAPESTAGTIIRLVTGEAAARCRDQDCARLLPHGRLSRHLRRHEAEPPFERALFAWLCGCCGFRRGHRVHQVRGQGARP